MTHDACNTESMQMASGGLGAVGLLDLTGVRSLDGLTTMGHIKMVGTALVPEAFFASFTTLPIGTVGDLVVVPTPVGGKIKVRKGQIQMSGEALANGTGNPADLLVVNGRLLITSPAEAVGYQQVIVVGQLLAPASSRSLLEDKLSCLIGEVLYYPEPFCLFTAPTRFDRAFFDLLEEPIHLVLIGNVFLASEVTADLLRAKVSGMTLVGKLTAPKSLVPLLHLLATTNVGSIEAAQSAQS